MRIKFFLYAVILTIAILSFTAYQGHFIAKVQAADGLTVFCEPDSSLIIVGGSINWTAVVTGANGPYQYIWSGTDGLTGSYQSATKAYTVSGTKTATVTVTSDGASKTATCSATVGSSPIIASCSANPANSARPGEAVTWIAQTSGGNGTYTYTWSGTESLTGSYGSTTKAYLTTGTKTATVKITSGGASKTATCSTKVVSWPPIIASCSASPASIYPGSSIVWTVLPSGGNGTYTYTWSGTDGLTGSYQSTTKAYSTTGTKTATVKIKSGGASKTATCSAKVVEDISAKITCVGAAVNTREGVLGTAISAYTQSINSAYSARKTALQQAYTKTTLSEINTAVNAAWSSFKSAKTAAQKAWTDVKKSAYSQYVTEALACKVPSGTGDGKNASSELKGQ